jgi:chromosome segregation ATPase
MAEVVSFVDKDLSKLLNDLLQENKKLSDELRSSELRVERLQETTSFLRNELKQASNKCDELQNLLDLHIAEDLQSKENLAEKDYKYAKDVALSEVSS